MKILLYCPVFYPMVGGMETVTECMADLFVKKGHECIVVTPVRRNGADNYKFKVSRAPGLLTKIRLILWADIVVSKGAALRLLPLVKLLLKPFVWIHSGYQASCIDGLGWVDGDPAPMTPWASVKYHYRRKGLGYAAREAVKLAIRRWASQYLVTMNVAVTDWVAMRQPFKRQVRIYNPFPIYRFRDYVWNGPVVYDFVYLGRLVSEKGLPTLINAFKLVQEKPGNGHLKLLIIGDGDWRDRLEALVNDLGLKENVTFAGRKTGEELTRLVYQSEIAVVPSEWEEPMGGVALELLAAGRSVIISRDGGLAECVGEAGLTFPNGDHVALAGQMQRLFEDRKLAEDKKEKAKAQVDRFSPDIFIDEYLGLFNSILQKK